jgi:hypothetical protein
MLAVACVVETDHHHDYGPSYAGGGDTPPPDDASPNPMLVEVDSDQVMAISAGDGVGVFVEYGTGGHWHVRWTSDTNASQVARSFDLRFTVSSGSFSNFGSEGFAATDQLYTTGDAPQSLEAITVTSGTIEGLHFDTAPGSVVLIDALVDGLHQLPGVSTFLFFVQDGRVNGGFQGTLTNPLMFQGKTP